MDTILTAATILGGLAAVSFLVEKFRAINEASCPSREGESRSLYPQRPHIQISCSKWSKLWNDCCRASDYLALRMYLATGLSPATDAEGTLRAGRLEIDETCRRLQTLR